MNARRLTWPRPACRRATTALGAACATALDQVSGQRDCHASRLFWYTDLDEAKSAAQREHKPILSLRLLGKLTDEYSCANSRFFRTTLYANDEISKVLRDRFILHWKSVRPVPRVTIDFGDGRKLERTLTGNSIHYVLDSDGQLIDALPGLYGPKAFLRKLDRAEKIAQQSSSLPTAERQRTLAAYHRERAAAIEAAWQADLAKLGVGVAAAVPAQQMYTAKGTPVAVPAAKAGPAAYGKWAVEVADRCRGFARESWNEPPAMRFGIGSRCCTPTTARSTPPA